MIGPLIACIAFKESRFYGPRGAVSDPIVVSRLDQKKDLSQRPPRLCGKPGFENCSLYIVKCALFIVHSSSFGVLAKKDCLLS